MAQVPLALENPDTAAKNPWRHGGAGPTSQHNGLSPGHLHEEHSRNTRLLLVTQQRMVREPGTCQQHLASDGTGHGRAPPSLCPTS